MKPFSALMGAVSFLTILPTPSGKRAGELPAAAVGWFPVVGGFIGWAGGAATFAAASVWPSAVAALLGVGAMALLTGGLHLDGFADTLDGFGARGGRDEILAVMRDSRIGAFGAAALFLLLGLKWALIQAAPSHRWIPILVASCALSRWGMVFAGYLFDYVPGKEGMGRLVTDRRSIRSLAWATGFAIAVALAATGRWSGLLAVGLAGAVAFGFSAFVARRLGGITGDALGAVNEAVELAVLLFLAAR